MERYIYKSSAVRAAIRMYGPKWRLTHVIYGSGNSKGTWDYGIFSRDYPEDEQDFTTRLYLYENFSG